VAVELSAENGLQLFIPEGFAHGYAVLSEEAVFQYKCSDYYHPESEAGIAWNDAALAIRWPYTAEEAMLSVKDSRQPAFHEAHLFE
ncbi:MAG: dTDP-4-dehydrorhamnose 3,5-epimerase family protein, partial [Alistipes sp.]|nr:dTDP-4-dehydrorhamnose 3,5-epimerase family protein [Alistipes sp.]